MVKKEHNLVVFFLKPNIIHFMNNTKSNSDQNSDIPTITDLGSVSDLTNGLGGSKEPGGFDGDFAPLQVS